MHTFENPYALGPNDPIVMIVDVDLKPGTEKEIEEIMAYAMPKNRAEEGCLEFSFYKVQGRAGKYVLIEKWRDQAALTWHMAQPYTQDVFAALERTLSYSLNEVFDHVQFVSEFSSGLASS